MLSQILDLKENDTRCITQCSKTMYQTNRPSNNLETKLETFTQTWVWGYCFCWEAKQDWRSRFPYRRAHGSSTQCRNTNASANSYQNHPNSGKALVADWSRLAFRVNEACPWSVHCILNFRPWHATAHNVTTQTSPRRRHKRNVKTHTQVPLYATQQPRNMSNERAYARPKFILPQASILCRNDSSPRVHTDEFRTSTKEQRVQIRGIQCHWNLPLLTSPMKKNLHTDIITNRKSDDGWTYKWVVWQHDLHESYDGGNWIEVSENGGGWETDWSSSRGMMQHGMIILPFCSWWHWHFRVWSLETQELGLGTWKERRKEGLCVCVWTRVWWCILSLCALRCPLSFFIMLQQYTVYYILQDVKYTPKCCPLTPRKGPANQDW